MGYPLPLGFFNISMVLPKFHREKKTLSWDDTMYPWFTRYPAENNIKIYLPNGDPTTRYSSLVENVFGLSLHPVTAIGTRPGGDDHDPGAMLQMDLSDYFAKKHKYQSLRMTFLTYVGLIQGLPELSKMVKLLDHPNLVCLKSWHLHIDLPPTLSRSFPVRFPSTEVSNVLLGAWQRVQSPLLWRLVGDDIIPHSWVVRGWTVEIPKHIVEKTI